MKIALIFLLLLGYTEIFSQASVPFLKKNGLYVFADSASMKPVNPKEYIFATGFSEGFAVIRDNPKYYGNEMGYVNTSGNVVVSPRFTVARDFHEGMASVMYKYGIWSFVMADGRYFDQQYDYAGDFSNGRAMIKKNGKYGFINKSGVEVIRPDFENVTSFSEGLAAVQSNGAWMLIDTTGKRILSLTYDKVGILQEGLLPVASNNLWGYIDKNGELLVPLQYEQASMFSEGLAPVRINGKWGCIDRSGKMVIPAKFDYVDGFYGGLSCAKKNGDWGYIDKSGVTKIPFKYNNIAYRFINGFAQVSKLVKKTSQYYYIDLAGREYKE